MRTECTDTEPPDCLSATSSDYITAVGSPSFACFLVAMTSSTLLYVNSPLLDPKSEIRLLQLLPASKDTPIECKLQVVSLRDCTNRYEALSYHWYVCTGNEILVNNCSIPVTRNLFNALHHLRQTEQSRTLWIDAICINQADDFEKNEQVRLMGAIYQNCVQVVAWLGLARAVSDRAMPFEQFVQRLLRAAKAMEGSDRGSSSLSIEQLVPSLIPDPNFESRYTTLHQFANNSWGSRSWIIQEVALAPEVILHCGSYTLKMEDAISMLSIAHRLDVCRQFSFQLLDLWSGHQDHVKGKQKPLLELLSRHALAEASRGHDKIYALCGLASDAGSNGLDIQIQYQHSVETVYIEFAKRYLQTHRNLDILAHLISHSKQPSSNLPSWVPDWRVAKQNISAFAQSKASIEQPDKILYTATNNSVANVRFTDSSRRLHLSGIIIDKIKVVGQIHMDEETVKHRLERVLQWRGEIGRYPRKKHYSPTSEEMQIALYHTMTAGILYHELESPEKDINKFDDDLMSLSAQCRLFSSIDQQNHLSFRDVWDSKVVLACHVFGTHRSLIRTKKGYLGLMDGRSRVGDSIALFQGGSLPFVIRRHGSDWEMVGNGYLHGAMNGKLYKERKCKPFWFV
jgi:hypothetical protein